MTKYKETASWIPTFAGTSDLKGYDGGRWIYPKWDAAGNDSPDDAC